MFRPAAPTLKRRVADRNDERLAFTPTIPVTNSPDIAEAESEFKWQERDPKIAGLINEV